MIDVKPVNFESEDKIFQKYIKDGYVKVASLSSTKDKDGIIITLKYQYNDKIELKINDRKIIYFKNLIYSKDLPEGRLSIKNVSGTGFTSEIFVFKDMVMAGKSDQRFSAPLQALLWGYRDGKFKDGNNPLKTYSSVFDLVKDVWGEMQGTD